MLKNSLIVFFKLAIGLGLIAYLVYSGRLDFSILKESLSSPHIWFLALTFQIFAIFFSTIRLRRILEKQFSKNWKLKDLLKVNWIGQLFSNILPGVVTGDLVKHYYLFKKDRQTQKRIFLFALLLDRGIGLLGLILLMSSSILLASFVTDIRLHPLLIQFSITVSVIGFSALVALSLSRHPLTYTILKKIPLIPNSIIITFQEVLKMSPPIKEVLKLIGISMMAQLSMIFSFYLLISHFVPESFNFLSLLCIAPIGFTAMAIPLTPGGIGVGHAVLEPLFMTFNIPNGSSLFNNYYFGKLFIALLGLFPYLSYKHAEQSETITDEVSTT